MALVIDAEGDNWEVKTWDWQSRNLTWSERIERVWSFAEAFAESAAIQWRLSLTSLGLMEVDEWQGEWLYFRTFQSDHLAMCRSGRLEAGKS